MKKLILFFALAAIAGAQNTLSLSYASQASAGSITSGGSDCSAAAACVWIVTPNAVSATVQVSGTYSGTLTFESSVNGSTWVAINDTAGASTTTSTGTFAFTLYGSPFLRVRCSSYSSGTATVSIASAIANPAASGQLVAALDLTGQAAVLGATTAYTTPATALYRVSCYVVETQAATSSSTLPACGISYTDETSTYHGDNWIGTTSAANAVGSLATGGNPSPLWFYALAGTAIQYQADSYASSGATPMKYSIHIRIESLQ